MLINIVTEMDRWLGQMSSLFVQRFNHLSPQEYCIMLLCCITVGAFLLRSRH